MIVDYIAIGRATLGVTPTREELVLERFFDETGGMQLVVHSPYGGQINRAVGLALRKKFCRTFNFELQAAANDDAVVLSLGPHHSFPLEDVPRYLSSSNIEDTLEHAILDAPMFQARWRWNLNRSLMVLRFRNGKRNPPPIQRMESDDLMAAVFPQAAACQDNVVGPIEIPDHVLVRQTIHDTLHEALDVDGTSRAPRADRGGRRDRALRRHDGAVGARARDPHRAPLRVPRRRGRDPEPAHERSRAAPRDVGRPHVDRVARRSRDRTGHRRDHTRADHRRRALRPLVLARRDAGRATTGGPCGTSWSPRGGARTSSRPQACPTTSASCGARSSRATRRSRALAGDDEAVVALLRGHLEVTGITTVDGLAGSTRLGTGRVASGLAVLEQEGFAFQGRYTPGTPETEWVARRLLARMHAGSRRRRRDSVQQATARDFMRFLLRWQHVAPGTQLAGEGGLAAVVEQLEGYEAAAAAWEPEVLTRRLRDYRPGWFDRLCHDGEVSWLRLMPRARDDNDAPAGPPSKATPITVVLRSDLGWLLAATRDGQRTDAAERRRDRRGHRGAASPRCVLRGRARRGDASPARRRRACAVGRRVAAACSRPTASRRSAPA